MYDGIINKEKEVIMYEIVGIVTMWVLRIGLFGLFIFACIDLSRFKSNITREVQTSETTWERRSITWIELVKSYPTAIIFDGFILLLDIFAWMTLIFF